MRDLKQYLCKKLQADECVFSVSIQPAAYQVIEPASLKSEGPISVSNMATLKPKDCSGIQSSTPMAKSVTLTELFKSVDLTRNFAPTMLQCNDPVILTAAEGCSSCFVAEGEFFGPAMKVRRLDSMRVGMVLPILDPNTSAEKTQIGAAATLRGTVELYRMSEDLAFSQVSPIRTKSYRAI